MKQTYVCVYIYIYILIMQARRNAVLVGCRESQVRRYVPDPDVYRGPHTVSFQNFMFIFAA